MPVKKILVPIRGDSRGENNLRYAAAVAQTHNAHIEVLHCRASAADMIPYGVVVPLSLRKQIMKQADELADSDQNSLMAEFDELLPKLGLTKTEKHSSDPLTASWREEVGKMSDLIGPWARLCDLVVVSRPERERNFGVRTLLSAIYECGRPVLMCPPLADTAPSVGQRIAIAWNGSLEATRAVALSLDLISAAEHVMILAGESVHDVNSGEALKEYFDLNGIAADLQKIGVDLKPGKAILDAAAVDNADLLVMGAYSHSRERELVFGGATQYVVDHADIPVLFAH